ncbi:ShlB/FhaC/HecB family hemolysin secretion/activation protein [Geotalea uraniireducens]|uniref:Polypeptide-transport-associated protein domain protein, ShlB-type n=1 Tax=Geotalea uraniireducens (strain Rf4) TaxID=351605 RepID=A5G4S0_GEOUR|nr:ShlB/FhaC/HecB family hemolysin secretion/activation protein [Geotalea uraniireducens]ABQ26788.1 Polypeptide-transport-associated protein domain protein, ShlB-type [Geotalea uraniireducens Rf4]
MIGYSNKKAEIHPRTVGLILVLCILILLFFAYKVQAAEPAPAQEQEAVFEISYIVIEGNTIFQRERLDELMKGSLGPGKTSADVEKARDVLEKFYHDEGYPTVLVNIPEQSVDGGVIRLQVIESKIGKVAVNGNRYFSTEMILKRIPSFQSGGIIFVPRVQQEIGKINRIPDLKVMPNMTPSREIGVVDVELKVEDHRPLHGSLELNNRSTQSTTGLRLNGALHYDNFWQRLHSISLQYQTSPQKLNEVQVVSGSYTLPAPWNDEQKLVLYGVWSDSQSAFGEGFKTVGKGNIVGARYMLPLAPKDGYSHSFVCGLDYKDFEDTVNLDGVEASKSPISYLPWSFAYSSMLQDGSGFTQFSAALNLAFRNLASDQQEFADKRFKGNGNYIYLTLGVDRMQKLPAGFGLHVKADGQISDQPLISNEQFAAGGMESVRGYRESEKLGDSAFHGSVELSSPDLASFSRYKEKAQCIPYLFYDAALLHLKNPLPAQRPDVVLQGAGFGVRGALMGNLEYQLDWGFALEDTEAVKIGDSHGYFRVKYAF